MNLWGICVTEERPVVVDVPETLDLLVTRAALTSTSPGPNVIFFEVPGSDDDDELQPITLGTLRYDKVEQFELDMCVCASSTIRFNLKGKGSVHLSGYFNTTSLNSGEFDSFDSSYDSSADEDFLSRTKSPSESIDDDDDADADEEPFLIEDVLPPRDTKGNTKAYASLVSTKKEIPKKEAPKKEAPKKEAPKKEAPKKEAPKKEAPKKEVPKKEAPKKEAPKKEAPVQQQSPKAEAGQKRKPEQAAATTPSPASKKRKTGGDHVCSDCSRGFTSESGLLSHQQAKHGKK